MLVDSIISVRTELRKSGLAKRSNMPGEMRDAYSQLIRKKTLQYLDSISAKVVHSYISFGSETGTRGIIEDLFERNIKVVVPITRRGKEDQQMIHSSIENLEHLHAGKFGVPEPEIIDEISLSDINAVLIPIVVFDGSGMRLGYGKGYYDRFISTLPSNVRRIGLAFSVQEVELIPKMSHDQLINMVITEQSNFIFD